MPQPGDENNMRNDMVNANNYEEYDNYGDMSGNNNRYDSKYDNNPLSENNAKLYDRISDKISDTFSEKMHEHFNMHLDLRKRIFFMYLQKQERALNP